MLPLLVMWLSPAQADPSVDVNDAAMVHEAWPLVRVEIPNAPGAILSSASASLLRSPPTDGTPWRHETIGEPDGAAASTALGADWTTGAFRATETLTALGAAPYRAAGHDGSGVKIAVFDIQWQDWELYSAELGTVETHDCARHSSCERPIDGLRPAFSFEFGSHGVACAELIADIAPGAELHLVQVSGGVSLENAVDWAIREQVDLVSMSLSYYGESFGDGTGPVSAQAERLAAHGIQLVTSAGNAATEHHIDAFRDHDGDSVHDGPDGSERVQVEWSAGLRRLNLHWDEFGACATDFDVFVRSPTGAIVGRGMGRQDPSDPACLPIERVAVNAPEDGVYDILIQRIRGPGAVDFELFARGGVMVGGDPRGSIADPGSSETALTVGAVNASGYLANPVEGFSSWGPTAAGLHKPDLVGPDGVSGAVYGNLGFFGTSASTPAVTGALALLLDARPGLTPIEAAALLRSHAHTMSPQAGPFDPARGAGAARLPPLDAQPLGCASGVSVHYSVGWLILTAVLAALSRRARAIGSRPR